ncbi:MAG TPA: ABC transporter ATP-binding protein [Gaiellaceae bacterium]|nr:ABC transporter ATP-binding protein [Gaiellaceae bacterium]
MPEPVIQVESLEKRYRVWAHEKPTNVKERLRVVGATARARLRLRDTEGVRRDVWALRGVSFDVHRGEVLGVIGRNGAGKSTLLSILARITEPTGGSAILRGRVSSLLEVGTGFHPELSGRDNVSLNGAILGMSRAETGRKFDEIVEFAGIRDFIDIPVKRYSTGMQVRLAFAVAAHLDPEVLLLDEVLAVGDAAFQARCLTRVEEMTRSGRTVLFVSHDVRSVARLCQRAIVLREGLLAFEGSADEAVEQYMLDPSTGLGANALPIREGSGAVRAAGVRVVDADSEGNPVPGGRANLSVRLERRAGVPLDELKLMVEVRHHSAGPCLFFATETVDLIAAEAATATLTCELDVLPLKPGHYTVATRLVHRDELVDRLDNAGDFVVGSGGLELLEEIAAHPAPTYVRHGWRAATPVAEVRSSA